MKHAWLRRHGDERLLIFFSGWGMDPRPFEYLNGAGPDVLMLFDYRETHLPEEVDVALGQYASCVLCAWSLGVAVANLRCGQLHERFSARVAINGTVRPVDSEEGIAPEVFDGTIRQLDGGGLARFIRRTCVQREVHERYMLTPVQRPLSELREELQVLRQIEVVDECLFQRAIASSGDRIFPYAAQVRCWENCGVPCTTMDAPHFPFYAWNSWEEVWHACGAD